MNDVSQIESPGCSPSEGDAQTPLLALVMVVKDEAHGITQTLESVKEHVDRWTILDTGSTDGTQEAVLRALEGIPGTLHEGPFHDFSTTYNRAFDLHGDATRFVLHLLGDEVVVGAKKLRDFLEHEPEGDAFYIAIQQGSDRYKLPRLSRVGSGWRYSGRTHETLGKDGQFPDGDVTGVQIVRGTAPNEAQRKRRRWQLDRRILEEDLEKNPLDPRATFYLAQTHECLGDAHTAAKLYQRRIELGGWADEVYEARFRLARCMATTGAEWPHVQQAYLDAHAFDPHRAEPLYAVAKHWYDQENHALAYLFAKRASELPRPETPLFVNAEVYERLAHEMVGISAFYLANRTNNAGVRQVGFHAADRAIAASPADDRLRDNRAHYCGFAAELWPGFQVKKLDLETPGDFFPMNPSVARVDDRWMCVIRTVNYKFLPDGGYEIPGDVVVTRNFIVELSDELEIIRAAEMEDRADRTRTAFNIRGYEDCRLFAFKGVLHATATVCDMTDDGLREMVLLTLDPDYAVVSAQPLRGPWSCFHQKNWMPVVKDEAIFLVYRTFPEVVLRCRPASDGLFTIDLPPFPHSFSPGRLRGGSQGIQVDGGWLFLVHDLAWHTTSSRSYLHRFVLMDDSLRVRSMSDPFFFVQKGIEFAAGLARDGDRLVASFGLDDAHAYLGVFDLPQVLASLREDYVV